MYIIIGIFDLVFNGKDSEGNPVFSWEEPHIFESRDEAFEMLDKFSPHDMLHVMNYNNWKETR